MSPLPVIPRSRPADQVECAGDAPRITPANVARRSRRRRHWQRPAYLRAGGTAVKVVNPPSHGRSVAAEGARSRVGGPELASPAPPAASLPLKVQFVSMRRRY